MRSIGFSSVLSSLIVGTGLVSFGLTACGEDPGPSYPNGTGNPSTTMDPTGATVSPTSSGPSLSPTVSPGNSSVSPTSTTPGNTSPGISPVTPQPSNTSPINPAPPASSPSNPQPTLPTTDDTDTSDTTMDTAAPQMPNTADSTVPNTADDSNVDPTDDSMGMQTDDTTVDATMATSDDTDGMDTTSDMMTEPDPGGPAPAEPSEGCGKQGSQTGSSGSPLTLPQFSQQYYVKLPNNYDANTPYRLLFMFNPTGNPINWAEQNAGFEAVAANDLIRVYPHPSNSSNGWNGSDVPFFGPLYDKVTQDYCVDKARVFAAGESSGGDYAGILGCEHADKIRAIGPCATKPVNGYDLNANSRNCTGQVSAVVIHGVDDSVVGTANGPLMRDFYRTLNNCSSMSMPVEGYTDVLSNCVQYQGCDEGYPVIWCSHDDPEYNNTSHGWPKFAARMLWQHFQTF